MQALSWDFRERRFVLRHVSRPTPGRGEVLVRIAYSALCGTDNHIMSGVLRSKAYNDREIVLGHAWSGRVEAVGSGVRDFHPGDSVFGSDYMSCGHCVACNSGQENLCDNRVVAGMEITG